MWPSFYSLGFSIYVEDFGREFGFCLVALVADCWILSHSIFVFFNQIKTLYNNIYLLSQVTLRKNRTDIITAPASFTGQFYTLLLKGELMRFVFC